MVVIILGHVQVTFNNRGGYREVVLIKGGLFRLVLIHVNNILIV